MLRSRGSTLMLKHFVKRPELFTQTRAARFHFRLRQWDCLFGCTSTFRSLQKSLFGLKYREPLKRPPSGV